MQSKADLPPVLATLLLSIDGQGNLKNWWAPQDNATLQARAQCIVNQYTQYTVVDNININSKLTLGEDMGDLGLAWGWPGPPGKCRPRWSTPKAVAA